MKNQMVRLLHAGTRIALAAFIFLGTPVLATTHIVQFGGSVGFAYSPASFPAVVGDTVTWEGDFSLHPLSSTSVPAGAATWHNGSGSSFKYVIRVAGAYHYQCDIHSSVGMTGSFTVTSSAVLPGATGSIAPRAATARVFSAGGNAYLQLNVGVEAFVSAALYSLDGKKLLTIVNTRLETGVYTIPLQKNTRGVHIVRILVGRDEMVKSVL